MGTGRFERLERERPQEPGSPRSSVETRFGDGGATGSAATRPDRTGAPVARFEEAAAGEALRVLDTDVGQSFVRCAACRTDSFLNATRCSSCGADLLTPAQRSFNEALWLRLAADKVEGDEASALVRERRAAADREVAAAVRRAPELLQELARRRALGLPLDDADEASSPLRAVARALGRFLGQVLGRAVGFLVRPGAGRS